MRVVKHAAIADLACVRDGTVYHVVSILRQVIELHLLYISRRRRLTSVGLYFRPVIHQHVIRDCDVQSQVVACKALIGIPAVFLLYADSIDFKRHSRRRHIRTVCKVLKLKRDRLFFFCLKVHVYDGIFLYIGNRIRISGVGARLVFGLYRFFCALQIPLDSPVVYYESLIGNRRQDDRLVLV